jgi:magnesium transporter
MPRTDLIVLSFGNVRAVAGLDHVFLFDAHSPLVQDFASELALCFSNNNKGLTAEPNELIFLEQVLRDTMEAYNRRLRLFEPIVDSFLDKVQNEVYSDTGVHQLVPLKDSLQSFEISVKQNLECLTELLNNDQEMLDILLTEQAAAKAAGTTIDFSRHEHVELLVGVYARQLSNIVMEIAFLLQRLQSKQEFVALALSGYRNRMIRMNVHIGIAGLSMGLGTTIAGFFGMNLITGLETVPFAFGSVVLGSGLAATGIAAGSLNYLSGHKMQMRAAQRMEEIDTLAGALSDMCALDYTVKTTIENGKKIDKEEFRKTLKKARQSKKASQKEVDLLFEVLDRVHDGELTSEDFVEYQKMPSGMSRGKR